MARLPSATTTTESLNAPAAATAPTYTYVDLPGLAETFADSIENTLFDGQLLRIEFCVGRLDALKSQSAATGRRYPTCRLVLSPTAAIDLMNRMQQIGAALVKAGVLKAAPGQTTPDSTN